MAALMRLVVSDLNAAMIAPNEPEQVRAAWH